jgi:CRP-like cAMP-binding protein
VTSLRSVELELRFAASDVLIQHGDAASHCDVIRSGEVLVSVTTSRRATIVIARLGPGSIVGELGALDGAPRTATARAIGDVRAVVLSEGDLEGLQRDHPDLGVAEVRRLSRQLRELTERYAVRNEELNIRLVQILRTHSDATRDSVFWSTREELAGWVGATRRRRNERLIVPPTPKKHAQQRYDITARRSLPGTLRDQAQRRR